jgi:glycosidase
MNRRRGAQTQRRSSCLTLFVVLCLAFAPRTFADQEHEFTYDARQMAEKPKSVHLAGTFNGWSRDATPMKQTVQDVWTVTLELPEGNHLYKFVLDGNKWVNDPTADKALEIDDGHGGMNSGVMVGPDARKLPPPKPNHIQTSGIVFDPSSAADCDAPAPGTLRLRLRAQAGDVEYVTVLHRPADAPPGNDVQVMQLSRLQQHGGYDLFGGLIRRDAKALKYQLGLQDGSAYTTVTASGINEDPSRGNPFDYGRSFEAQLRPRFTTPDWAKHAVWYQIFPERFRNGDESNDPGDKWFERKIRWTSDWWKTQPGETPGDENFYKGEGNVWKRRYGGDIQGVKQALPYLRQLGVTAIYFNPVFEAESMHKYDTADYRHIDDNFGVREQLPLDGETDDPATWKWSKSDRLFLEFVEDAHRQGFKVILDGVFNHVGRAHPFFQDVVRNGKASKYADWFEIEAWPDQLPAKEADFGKPGGLRFKAWDKSSGHLPVLRKDPKLGLHAPVRDHIFAITKRWLAPDGDPSKGIDGWRLDVPGDIPHPFWIEWRKVVKSTKPDAYISGEIWTWAQPWLNNGDQFDAVMNYRFAVAVQDFFVNEKKAISVTEFNARNIEQEFNYPFQVALVQQNLFDSHDTDRFASMFMNPDRAYDAQNRPQDNAADIGYDPKKPGEREWARNRQAVAFQMSCLGAPMIYYGNEAGMWSPDDPSNRQPMVWKELEPYDDLQVKFDQRHFEFYQRVIAIRAALEPLRLGFFRPVLIDDARNIYAFARELDQKVVYVVINRNDSPATVELPVNGVTGFIDWMDAESVEVKQDSGARPAPSPRSGARQISSNGGKLTVELKPFGTAILAAQQ